MLYAPKMFAIFVANLWFQSIHESSPKDIQTCLVRENLNFSTHKGAHKYRRDVKFPMLFGMELVKRLWSRPLHPNIHTEVGFGIKFNVHHIKYALYSALYFQVIIHSGLAAQNYPFKADNNSIETRIPTWKWRMSNSRWFRKCSLRIPSHRGLPLRYALCPEDVCYLCCKPMISKHPWIFSQGVFRHAL